MSTAKKAAKGQSKPRSTKPATKPSKAATASEQTYGTHNEGSRKGKVHELFDKEGPDAAWVLGLRLKLKEGTLRSWLAAWKRLQGNSKAEVNTNSAMTPDAKPEILAA
jgi:hypothetical protein